MAPWETKLALWFLHHYAGTLMYFPDIPELEDMVISDVQIIFDSVTNMIIHTFQFGNTGTSAQENGSGKLDNFRSKMSKKLYIISKKTRILSTLYHGKT